VDGLDVYMDFDLPKMPCQCLDVKTFKNDTFKLTVKKDKLTVLDQKRHKIEVFLYNENF
jgi:hypothetical protein